MSKEGSVVMRHPTYDEESAVNVEESICGIGRVRGWRGRLKRPDEVGEAAREHRPDEVGKSP
jgi:hypothetical protein